MKYLLPVVLIAILTSCSGDLKQYQTPENGAMSAVELPLYEGITDIMRGNSFKTLPPATQVYLTNQSATANNVQYVKITWGDSSAYAQTNLLIPKGTLAVVTSDGNDVVNIYNDAGLTPVLDIIDNDWGLVVAGEAVGDATPTMNAREDGTPLFGFVKTQLVTTTWEAWHSIMSMSMRSCLIKMGMRNR